MAATPPNSSPSRRAPGETPQASSSFATGDLGGRYQDRVDGWALAQLFMRRRLAAVPGTIVRAGFQRSVHGALLDDAVLWTDADVEVQLSIKIGAAITEHDHDFRDTLMLAWQVHCQGHWSGIVIPPQTPGYGMLRRLVYLAHEVTDTDDFMARTAPGVLADQPRIEACRHILDAAADAPISNEQFHAFLRNFVILGSDFDLEPSGDEANIVAALEVARSISQPQAQALFSALVEIGENLAAASGAIDADELGRRLQERGVAAGFAPDFRPLDNAVRAYAERSFESQNATVAGVHLDRQLLVDTILERLADRSDVVVTGATGFGKSTVIRSLVEKLENDGPVLHLTGSRVENARSWPHLAAEIGVPADLGQLAALLAMHPRGATVVLDAAEHVISPGARTAVNDLLRELRRRTPLHVVLGVRDAGLTQIGWVDPDVLQSLARVDVGAPTEEEMAAIAAASPVLGELIARAPSPFPGGLKLLSLLHDTRIAHAALANTPATEADLFGLWWHSVVVGGTDAGHERRRAVLAMADAAVAEPSGFFELPGVVTGATAGGLIRDGILQYDGDLDRYRFGHDIIRDWSIEHWIAQGPAERLAIALAAPGNYRAVSLFAQRMAERNPAQYVSMRGVVGALPDARGANAFLAALVVSPYAQTLLGQHAEMLLADDGRELAALVQIVRVEQISLDVELVDRLRKNGNDTAEAISVAAELSPPRWRVWLPLIAFCLENIDALGVATYPFLQMAKRWQETTPVGTIHRRGILTFALRVVTFFESWRRHGAGDRIGIRSADRRTAETLARSIIGHSAVDDPATVKTYLDEVGAHGYADDQRDMLKASAPASHAFPDEVITLATQVLIAPDRMPWEAEMNRLGIEDFEYFPPSDLQPPFLALLRENEHTGLAVVRLLAKRAMQKFATHQGGANFRGLTFTYEGTERTMRGTGQAYAWYRPASHDSHALTSALMAVDTWAFDALLAGRDPREILALLLAEDAPIPFLGIAVGLAYDYGDLIPLLADLFAQPWFWRLEGYRYRLDALPIDYNSVLPMSEQLPTFKPHLAQRNRDRDARRAQNRYPTRLVAAVLFDPRFAQIRDGFIASARRKTLVDATLFDEEADAAARTPEARGLEEARANLTSFARITDPDAYERVDGESVRLRPTAADAQAAADAKLGERIAAAHAMVLMAGKLLQDYTSPDFPATFEQVGKQFEALGNEAALPAGELPTVAHATIAAACVAATFMPLAGLNPSWSAERVLAAVRENDASAWREDDEDGLLDTRVQVATALGSLFAANPDEDELRRYVFRLSTRVKLLEVINGLERGLIPLWTSRPSSALSVFSVMIESALRVDGDEPIDEATVAAAEANDHAGRTRPWPALTIMSRPAIYRMGEILRTRPRRYGHPDAVEGLVPLVEALLDAAATAPDDNEGVWLKLRGAIGRLAASLAVELTDSCPAFLARLGTTWETDQDIYADMMAAIARFHFNTTEFERSAARFAELAAPFLAANHAAEIERTYLSREFRDACWSLIWYADFEGLIVPEESPSLERFTQHIGRWVNAVGGHPTNAAAFLHLLEGFAPTFGTTVVVAWLRDLLAATPAQHWAEFWRINGSPVGVLLLQLATTDSDAMRDPATHLAAADIAGQLLAQGIAGAAELRDALEGLRRM